MGDSVGSDVGGECDGDLFELLLWPSRRTLQLFITSQAPEARSESVIAA